MFWYQKAQTSENSVDSLSLLNLKEVSANIFSVFRRQNMTLEHEICCCR